MISITNSMVVMNTLDTAYTYASIAVDLGTGNYVGASMDIAEEIANAKLGRVRWIGTISDRGVTMFSNVLWRNGIPPALDLNSLHAPAILRDNLKKLGFNGAGNAAHHIVANLQRADIAKGIMQRAGINPNAPSNGVFLPNTTSSTVMPITSPHVGSHNYAYYDHVNVTLLNAVENLTPGTKAYKQAVVNALTDIRLQLLTGQLSLNKHSAPLP